MQVLYLFFDELNGVLAFCGPTQRFWIMSEPHLLLTYFSKLIKILFVQY